MEEAGMAFVFIVLRYYGVKKQPETIDHLCKHNCVHDAQTVDNGIGVEGAEYPGSNSHRVGGP